MPRRSDLPFGSEFSPSQISLPHMLELAMQNGGNQKAFEAAVKAAYFADNATSDRNKDTLAMNARLGMSAYGVINREDASLTDFGRQLYTMRQNGPALYAMLARHILLNLKGMALVQCIRDMTIAGEEVNLSTLRQGLAERGVHYPPGGKHPSIMRLWLEKAGVFVGKRWQIDEIRLQEVLGTNTDEYSSLASLTHEQRAFLRALANTGRTDLQPANEIARLAEATYGVRFPEKSLPKLVLNPLMEAGYITTTKTTKGRGAKPFLIAPTEKLVTEIVTPLLDQLKNQTDPKLIALLRKPLAEILVELDSDDRYIAGLALEALAFKLMRYLDMDYVATRLRAQATGGAEVDLIFQSARLVFSRWQVQCKNTSRVSLDDVAKEVGLTHLLKSNVIVVVSTGEAGSEARRYSNKIMAESNLCIVMIDGRDLTAIRDNPTSIVSVFQREARCAMALKKLDDVKGEHHG